MCIWIQFTPVSCRHAAERALRVVSKVHAERVASCEDRAFETYELG